MKNIHLVLIIAILILIYLISMKWLGGHENIQPQNIPETPKMVFTEPQPLPAPQIETVATPPVLSEETVAQIVPPAELTDTSTTTTLEADSTKQENPQLIEYKNANYGYHLSIPKKMYYAGFGATNGALHILAVQSDAIPESLETATVKVFYYGKKILPELQNATNNRYQDPAGKYILLLLNGAYSVKIESNNLNSPAVKAIESTIGID